LIAGERREDSNPLPQGALSSKGNRLSWVEAFAGSPERALRNAEREAFFRGGGRARPFHVKQAAPRRTLGEKKKAKQEKNRGLIPEPLGLNHVREKNLEGKKNGEKQGCEKRPALTLLPGKKIDRWIRFKKRDVLERLQKSKRVERTSSPKGQE